MKSKIPAFLSFWVILLPVGVATLTAIRPKNFLPYDDHAFGMVHGVVQGSIVDTERDISSSFEGRTEPKWEWRVPSSFQYERGRLEWTDGKKSDGGVLDLATMLLEKNGQQIPVDAEWFRRLLKNRPLAEECVSVLDDARTGSLPAPGQLPRSYNRGSLRRSLDHQVEGVQVPYSALVWTGVWLAGLGGILVSRSKDGPAIPDK